MKARVAIDANILFAAMLSPHGDSRRLLQLAAAGIFHPIITSEVLAEFDRHCRLGFRGRAITDEETTAFRRAIHPLLEHEEVPPGAIGRAASEHAPAVNVDNRLVIRRAPEQPARGESRRTRQVDAVNAELKDMGDAHVLASAVRYGCSYLCTANTRDFPEGEEIAGVRFISPRVLLARLLEEDGEAAE
jgi:predicted nucleic acid-binding protein